MRIKGRIFLCLLSVFMFLMVTVATTYIATKRVSYFRERSLTVERTLLKATYLRAQVRNQLLETFDALYVSGLSRREERLETGKAEVQKKFQELKGSLNGEFLQDLQEVETSYQNLQASLDQSVGLYKRGNVKAVHAALIDARENKFQNGFIKEITDVIDAQTRISKRESKNLEISISRLKTSLVLFAVLALILMFCISAYVSSSVGKRLALIEAAALEVSQGNLSISLDERGEDEVSALARAMNQMASSLDTANKRLRKQQAQLVMSSKMSSLGEMAGGIAHEINNPMAVIQLHAEILRDCCRENNLDRKYVEESCDTMIRTSTRVAKIIAGLLTFSRDGKAAGFRSARLQAIVEDTFSFCRERFRSNGIPLDLEAPLEPAMLECRAPEISQVLLNLISNAYDAVQELQEKWIKVNICDIGKEIEISVTDSGLGIPEAVRDKMTQPFFTTKEIGKGTGLGLSISKGIVESHGGRLFIDASCANTRIVVILPKVQTSEARRAS